MISLSFPHVLLLVLLVGKEMVAVRFFFSSRSEDIPSCKFRQDRDFHNVTFNIVKGLYDSSGLY